MGGRRAHGEGRPLKRPSAEAETLDMVMLSRTEVDSWRRQALCAGHPERGAWFAEDGEAAKRAKAVCRACPVTSECLEYSLATGPHDGIWGGTTPSERRRLRKARLRSR